MHMDRKTGRRMAAARVEADITTEEMAEIVGRSVAAVRAYERAVNEPPGSVMNEWAKATGKALSYFYGETPPAATEAHVSHPDTPHTGAIAQSP